MCKFQPCVLPAFPCTQRYPSTLVYIYSLERDQRSKVAGVPGFGFPLPSCWAEICSQLIMGEAECSVSRLEQPLQGGGALGGAAPAWGVSSCSSEGAAKLGCGPLHSLPHTVFLSQPVPVWLSGQELQGSGHLCPSANRGIPQLAARALLSFPKAKAKQKQHSKVYKGKTCLCLLPPYPEQMG